MAWRSTCTFKYWLIINNGFCDDSTRIVCFLELHGSVGRTYILKIFKYKPLKVIFNQSDRINIFTPHPEKEGKWMAGCNFFFHFHCYLKYTPAENTMKTTRKSQYTWYILGTKVDRHLLMRGQSLIYSLPSPVHPRWVLDQKMLQYRCNTKRLTLLPHVPALRQIKPSK